MGKPRVKVPKSAKAGEVITIKTLIKHKMESGRRKDKKTGELVPRNIINMFSASFNGEEVIKVDLHGSVSTNPYFQFQMKVPESGELAFKWADDDGNVTETTSKITVG